MHHRQATALEFLPRIYDIISADYDVSTSCRFSHATAHIYYFPKDRFCTYPEQGFSPAPSVCGFLSHQMVRSLLPLSEIKTTEITQWKKLFKGMVRPAQLVIIIYSLIFSGPVIIPLVFGSLIFQKD